MKKTTPLIDERILLSSPADIRVNDRLQRNAEMIVSKREEGDTVVVVTRFYETPLPKGQEVYVWRLTPSF